MQVKVIVSLILCQLCWISSSYKILGIFPHPGKSHFDNFEPLVKALAAKGHEVTTSHITYNDKKMTFTGSRMEKYLASYTLAHMGWTSCHQGLSHKALQDFVKNEPKFDVAIVEYFDTDCYLAIPYKLKIPIIGISSCIVEPWTDLRLEYPSNPSYIPNNYMPFSDQMTFLERVENTILYLVHHTVFKFLIDIPGNRIAKEYFGEDLPPLQEIAGNTSLVLANMHFSLTRPRPLVPGYIEVGGMNIGEPKKLPQNIEKWINESTEGVIYFSMGSMLKASTFPKEKKEIFLRVFRRLPQRIVWKWEDETLSGKPDNVLIQKWMPQFDILCHPNVKAFITHGGLLGTTEAVHCGVPLVIMPQFGDQFTNAKVAEASGAGVILDYWCLDEESLYDVLKVVLDPNFYNARFKDRPLSPLNTAIYWVEYVARHGGAPHLKTAAVDMALYQYLLVDVILFLGFTLLVIGFAIYLLISIIVRKILRGGYSKK